ncbi:Hypothetical protein ACI5QL_03983 [Bacillus velezensis]
MLCCPYIRRVSPQSGSLQNHEDYFIKKANAGYGICLFI